MNYQQQSLAGLNGIELIIALYDGMARFLHRAIEAIEGGDVHARRRAIKRVFDILIHLQARLWMDVGGSPARALSDFYTAMFALALQGSQEESKDKLLQAIAGIRNVREAWQQVALDPAAQKMIPRNLQTVEERISSAALPLLRSKPDHYDSGDGTMPESCQWMA
ncbi:Flagellar biosynthesis protein FliS [Acidisarcina polymorpha]|uniref:Flagellar biosynthesis protein FliS n=1 Tax=Acidisarcina polymorpha TaxID=2211140 RepID=A0A2Z5G754_9BACT|nr:flagellar export chaperone FliS [Acidisarcina polymorpha]AXC14838.1 Flagellar biosynthesis protein FliS [Acidisarcina polymorpha]